MIAGEVFSSAVKYCTNQKQFSFRWIQHEFVVVSPGNRWIQHEFVVVSPGNNVTEGSGRKKNI